MIRKYYMADDPAAGASTPPAVAPPVAAPTIAPAVTTDGGGGNPPGVPAAPKGYTVSTPQQRTEWNGFLDYLDKQGIAGKPELDQPAENQEEHR